MKEKNPTPHELEYNVDKLRTFLNQHEIECVGWDIDGTLVDTTEIFSKGIDRANSWLRYGIPLSSIDNPEQKKSILKLRDYTRSVVHGVRPERNTHPSIMDISIRNTALHLEVPLNSDRLNKAREEIQKIYNGKCPDPYPGAVETLKAFEQTGVSQIVATHAGRDWTLRKIRHMGLNPYMFDHLICMDVCATKEEQWESLLTPLGIDFNHFIFIGDNAGADIKATQELGARAVFINKHQKPHPELENRNRIQIVKNISEVIPTLINSMC